MQYLQRVYDLAEFRGYFRFPEVLALQDRIPDWFRATRHCRRACRIGGRARRSSTSRTTEFYGCFPLACFSEAAMDGEVFLADLATIIRCELPPLVTWSSEQYLVFSFHGHSGTVCAVQLGSDDPRVFWGPTPIRNRTKDDRPPV